MASVMANGVAAAHAAAALAVESYESEMARKLAWRYAGNA